MGEFAKAAVLMISQAAGEPPGPQEPSGSAESSWEQRLAEQEARLHAHVPSTREETSRKAVESLKRWQELAATLGYAMRAEKRPAEEEMEALTAPAARELTVRMPHVEKKALLGAVTDPLQYGLQDLRTELRRAADEKREELTRVTGEPSTLPWYYPAMALNLPKAFAGGYRKADEDAAARQHAVMDAKLEEARKSFERALTEEYAESRKTASAGAFVDGLARSFTKEGEGEANTALGAYLALAALLGLGTHTAARRWVERHDPAYQQARAVQQAISQRARGAPAPILVSTTPSPEETADSATEQAAG